MSQAILFGFSLRCSDNRFKEGLLNALFSAVTLSPMNTTVGNQSTHCLLVRPSPPYPLTVEGGNSVLFDALLPRFCALIDEILSGFGRAGGQQGQDG